MSMTQQLAPPTERLMTVPGDIPRPTAAPAVEPDFDCGSGECWATRGHRDWAQRGSSRLPSGRSSRSGWHSGRNRGARDSGGPGDPGTRRTTRCTGCSRTRGSERRSRSGGTERGSR
jgi:hypothetical protein